MKKRIKNIEEIKNIITKSNLEEYDKNVQICELSNHGIPEAEKKENIFFRRKGKGNTERIEIIYFFDNTISMNIHQWANFTIYLSPLFFILNESK